MDIELLKSIVKDGPQLKLPDLELVGSVNLINVDLRINKGEGDKEESEDTNQYKSGRWTKASVGGLALRA